MRSLLLLSAILSLASGVRAQGLVQISFFGEVSVTGGARVEADVSFADAHNGGTPRAVSLALLLGERTGATDFALLFARRLEQGGARVIFTGGNAPFSGPVTVFVEDALSVGLKLGSGLTASVTLCEDRPASVKLTPGIESKLGASFQVVAHTYEPHAQEHGRLALDLRFNDKSEVADVGLKLVKSSIGQGWPAELTGHDTWRPSAQTETAVVIGCCFELRSDADWRLDVALAPRPPR